MKPLLLALVLAIASLAAEPAPVWSSRQIADDPLFFIQAEGTPAAKATLLFVPEIRPLGERLSLISNSVSIMTHGSDVDAQNRFGLIVCS